MYKVFFADKVTTFAVENQASQGKTLQLAPGQRISRDNVLQELQDTNDLWIVSPETEAVFHDFCAEFTPVEAAGGVVENRQGEFLLIYRNNRWDLPKGHIEPGEQRADCAVREVSEECGIPQDKLRIEAPLTDTLHFYYFPKTSRWELKRTYWYRMHCDESPALAPQQEEGISRVEWVAPQEAIRRAASSYKTIQAVIAALPEKRKQK